MREIPTSHTSTFVVTKITTQTGFNVNHPRGTFARAKTPRGQKSSSVGRFCFFFCYVTLILKSVREFLLCSTPLNNVFTYYTFKKAILFVHNISVKRCFRFNLYESLDVS